jgi:aspartyl-tRNA(Asn)/glutamyl-tRNA(Gln) amidotransferase subunit B
MRVDVNVSVSSDTITGNRVEIKNVAGARNVERAVEYEYRRHIELLSRGVIPEFETRRYDAERDVTHSLRRKEVDPDYRFF